MDRRALLIGILWLALLAGFLAYAAWPVGTTVTLQLAPVDPTDLLRGEYLALGYAIGQVGPALADWEFARGDTVYVALEEGDAVWVARGYWHTRPADGVFLKGTVDDNGRIAFGIERYFIPEGSDADVRVDETWTARVRADGDGNARLLELLQDGVPVTFRYDRAQRS